MGNEVRFEIERVQRVLVTVNVEKFRREYASESDALLTDDALMQDFAHSEADDLLNGGTRFADDGVTIEPEYDETEVTIIGWVEA